MMKKILLTILFMFKSEDLIIPESMTQDFGFTGVLGKLVHKYPSIITLTFYWSLFFIFGVA